MFDGTTVFGGNTKLDIKMWTNTEEEYKINVLDIDQNIIRDAL